MKKNLFRTVLLAVMVLGLVSSVKMEIRADEDDETTCSHDWRISYADDDEDDDDDEYIIDNDDYSQHQRLVHYECRECGATKSEYIYEDHDWEECGTECEKYDDEQHTVYKKYYCLGCGMTKTETEGELSDHYSFDNGNVVKEEKYNDTYHKEWSEFVCEDCGYTFSVYELKKHNWEEVSEKDATITKKGYIKYQCEDCKAVKYKYFSWKYGSSNCLSYNISHKNYVYRTDKSIKLYLDNPLKGGVVKLKIGKKTYTKKLTTASTTVKIKISKPKYNSKITINVYYKNKLVGKHKSCSMDKVLYAKAVKKGMTMKEVKYTWGKPSGKTKKSGGKIAWLYSDGSYAIFKNGKVESWYDNAK